MESLSQNFKRVQAEELLSRFRSKEDLFRYMVHQGKSLLTFSRMPLVGLYLPSMDGTKLAYMRAILKEEKKALKSADVVVMEIPLYAEISVKNLYDDVMNDPEVAVYLPTREQCSNKLPERHFFFGVLATVRTDYMKEIIKEAHDRRYKLQENDKKREGILLSDAWLEELTKHPYFSSKLLS